MKQTITPIVIILLMLFTSCARQLNVSLYLYIPDADNYYRKIETEFEKRNPEINLVIKLNGDYYDPKNGVISEEADIYEVDCILLEDFIKKQKIQKLERSIFLFEDKDLMPASHIVNINNNLYGIPHWLCGNFLFYNGSDSEMSNIKNLNDLEKVIGINPGLKKGLLIDIKGGLTLGELYADALLDHYSNIELVKKHSTALNLDRTAIDNLNRLPQMTYNDWGRRRDYHKKIGFYQSQFAKGNGRAFVGYSESLYYIIDEINNSCYNEEDCILSDQIAINEFPISNNGSTAVGWVDAFTIDKKVNGKKLNDAIVFINYLISQDAYQSALIPDYGHSPRYLLPAYKKIYNDDLVLKKAPYYRQLFPLALKITSFTEQGIAANLNQIGEKLDEEEFKN